MPRGPHDLGVRGLELAANRARPSPPGHSSRLALKGACTRCKIWKKVFATRRVYRMRGCPRACTIIRAGSWGARWTRANRCDGSADRGHAELSLAMINSRVEGHITSYENFRQDCYVDKWKPHTITDIVDVGLRLTARNQNKEFICAQKGRSSRWNWESSTEPVFTKSCQCGRMYPPSRVRTRKHVHTGC